MKRMIAMALCFVMVMALLCGCGGGESGGQSTQGNQSATKPTEYVPKETPEVQLHTPAEAFAGGDGTEANPYQISTAEELALMNAKIAEDSAYNSACYVLTADISLNDTTGVDGWAESAPEYGWEPIGRTGSGFDGIFDGDGHTISGLYLSMDAANDGASERCYGLFGKVTGTVRNVSVEKSYLCVSGPDSSTGAVAGKLNAEDARVENCASSAVIDHYNGGNAGGIVGSGYGSVAASSFSGSVTQRDSEWSHLGGIAGADCAISSCTNLGTVSGSGYSGGIVGYGSVVMDCANQGSVTGETAGGIMGSLYQVGTGLELTVTELGVWNCENAGTVSAVAYAGGIAGKVANDESDVDMYISGCANQGNVLCDQAAAGIIGNLAAERANILKVENCVNHADITGKDKVGGILCELTGSVLHQEGRVTISGCENHGAITSTEGMYAGGIVTYFVRMGAEVDLELTIENCTNTGAIESPSNAGGILCFSSSGLTPDAVISPESAITFRGCTNSGAVTGRSSNSYVGGIAAVFSAEGIPATFENCANTGDVTLDFTLTEEEIQDTLESEVTFTITQMAGGIVGRLGEGMLLTTDNDEGSEKNVNAANAKILFTGCSSTGAIRVPDYSAHVTDDGRQIWVSHVGGIIGNTCAEDAYAFRVENCTYTGAVRGLGNPEYPDVGTMAQ